MHPSAFLSTPRLRLLLTGLLLVCALTTGILLLRRVRVAPAPTSPQPDHYILARVGQDIQPGAYTLAPEQIDRNCVWVLTTADTIVDRGRLIPDTTRQLAVEADHVALLYRDCRLALLTDADQGSQDMDSPLPRYCVQRLPPHTVYLVQVAAANTRAGPGTDYGQLGQLSRGQAVEGTCLTKAGDWLYGIDPATVEPVWVFASLLTTDLDGFRPELQSREQGLRRQWQALPEPQQQSGLTFLPALLVNRGFVSATPHLLAMAQRMRTAWTGDELLCASAPSAECVAALVANSLLVATSANGNP